MNQRAFNFLSSIVAATLVVIAFLLISMMADREKTTSSFIANIEKKSKVEALVNLTRADALQTVNYGIRKTIEEWIDPIDEDVMRSKADAGLQNSIALDNKSWEKWEYLVDDFVKVYFGVNPDAETSGFASTIANRIKGIFQVYGYTYGPFKISIEYDNEKFKEVMHKLITESYNATCSKKESDEKRCTEGRNGLIQLIPFECDRQGTPDTCNPGTFYLTLRTSRLFDESVVPNGKKLYEQLPLIVIEDLRTNTKIKDPILPDNDIRFYVPLRLFKALAIAKRFAHFKIQQGGKIGDFTGLGGIDYQSDYGFLSPRMHNEFESMKLGLCDYGVCNPRTNPYMPPKEILLEADNTISCPNSGESHPKQMDNVEIDPSAEKLGHFLTQKIEYNPSEWFSDGSLDSSLENIVKQRLCWIAYNSFSTEMNDQPYHGEIGAPFKDPTFVIGPDSGDCGFLEFGLPNVSIVDAKTTPSKTIENISSALKLVGPSANRQSDISNPNTAPDATTSPSDWFCPFNYVNDDYFKYKIQNIGGNKIFIAGQEAGVNNDDSVLPFIPNVLGAK